MKRKRTATPASELAGVRGKLVWNPSRPKSDATRLYIDDVSASHIFKCFASTSDIMGSGHGRLCHAGYWSVKIDPRCGNGENTEWFMDERAFSFVNWSMSANVEISHKRDVFCALIERKAVDIAYTNVMSLFSDEMQLGAQIFLDFMPKSFIRLSFLNRTATMLRIHEFSF